MQTSIVQEVSWDGHFLSPRDSRHETHNGAGRTASAGRRQHTAMLYVHDGTLIFGRDNAPTQTAPQFFYEYDDFVFN